MQVSETENRLRDALDNQRAINRIMELALSDDPLESILYKALVVLFSVSWLRVEPRGAVFLAEPSSGILRLTAQYHLDTPLLSLCSQVPFGHCLCGRAARSKTVEYAHCVDHRHDIEYSDMAPHGHYSVPILDRDQTVLGVFVLYVEHGHAQTDSEREFLLLVAQTLATVIKRKKLEVSRNSLARIVEEAACEIYEFDTETLHFLRANKAAIDNLGYDRDELRAMTPADLLILEGDDNLETLLEPLRDGHVATVRFQAIQRRKNGTSYDVDVTIQKMCDRNEAEFVTILNDITQYKTLTNMLNTAIDNFPGGISVYDKDLTLTLVNDTFYEVFGVTREDYPLGSSFESLVRLNVAHAGENEETIEKTTEEMVRLVKTSGEHYLEQRLPNGAVWEIRGKPIAGGGFVSTQMDITRRTEAEQEAIEAQERLISALETIKEGFVLYDADDRLVLCNSKYREIYAESAELLVPGTPFADIVRGGMAVGQYAIAEGQEEAWFEERLAMHQAAEPSIVEQMLGNGRWVLIAEQRTPDGGSVGIRVDITERKLTEMELSSYRQHLEELVADRTMQVEEQAAQLVEALERETALNEIQRQFVSMASHEFRTPLAIIDGAAQRLVRRAHKAEPEEIVQRATRIRGAIKQMIGLMESTLAAERIDNGTFSLDVETCHLRTLIQDCCEQQRYISPNAEIHMALDALPEEIDADTTSIESAINNLLSNAIKYSPGAPVVEISGATDEGMVHICIRDEGLGIDEDDIPRLFSRYFRARSSSGIPGTGIGLNLVRMIAEKHGGDVEVFSQKGKGSTFVLSLPLRQTSATEDDAPMALNG